MDRQNAKKKIKMKTRDEMEGSQEADFFGIICVEMLIIMLSIKLKQSDRLCWI